MAKLMLIYKESHEKLVKLNRQEKNQFTHVHTNRDFATVPFCCEGLQVVHGLGLGSYG